MMRSLYSAVSGLKTHQTKMDVIGNNISNVNTVSFKGSSVTFNDIMYQNISGASGPNAATGVGGINAKQVGLGVGMGSVNINITTPGSAESTGRGLDLRLTDANSTNFFIVSNGSENLFTRAGSFYMDGSGNLAMTSTGYNVMGWQVDPATGTIKKDTVSALRIMQEKNMTSSPEATKNATVGGVLDKNDTNINSDGGYNMNLNFYDNLGYRYTAKFSVKVADPKTETYTVELNDILDSENKSILTEYLQSNPGASVSDIFGKNTTSSKSYNIKDPDVKYAATAITDTTGAVLVAAGSYYKTYDTFNASGDPLKGYALVTLDPTTDNVTVAGYTKYASAADATAGPPVVTTVPADATGKVTELFGISAAQLGYLGSAGMPTAAIVNGQFQVTSPAVNYTLKFNQDNGTFSYVGDTGQDSASLNLAATLGNKFSDISIDFASVKSSDNGGKGTMGIDPGAADGTTGAGKALGALKDVAVDTNGMIYGTYTNGNTVLLGQVAVAQFANASGLEKVGDNCYSTTLNSGDFDGVGVDIKADGSGMTSGELEMSNVDLASEFTQMIVTQRGYQASSRVITTSDSLLEELINLKR